MHYPKIIDMKKIDEKIIFFFDTGYAYKVWEEDEYATACSYHYFPGSEEDRREIEYMEQEMLICEALAFRSFEIGGKKPKEFYVNHLKEMKDIWAPVYELYG